MLTDEELRELYQEVILDHQADPRNFGSLVAATHKADGHNPLCGDRVHVAVQQEDGVIKDIAFTGEGCAISTASASLMTETLKGKSIQDAEAVMSRFLELVTGKLDGASDLGDLQVLAGVREFPARVKCATLAWHTLESAIHQDHQPNEKEKQCRIS